MVMRIFLLVNVLINPYFLSLLIMLCISCLDNSDSDDSNNTIYIIAAAGGGLFILLVIVIIIVTVIACKKCSKSRYKFIT